MILHSLVKNSFIVVAHHAQQVYRGRTCRPNSGINPGMTLLIWQPCPEL
ncbi:MAG: hypothetical protein ACK55Z_34070 [bacterium]